MGYYNEGGTFDIRHEAFIDNRYEMREPEVSNLTYDEAVKALKDLSDRILNNYPRPIFQWQVAHQSQHVLMIYHNQYAHTYAIVKHDPTVVATTLGSPSRILNVPISDDVSLVVWSDNPNLIHVEQYDGDAILTPQEAFQAGQKLVEWGYNKVIETYASEE
jgi:hypothetical protein